jgi:hypothetical protein
MISARRIIVIATLFGELFHLMSRFMGIGRNGEPRICR